MQVEPVTLLFFAVTFLSISYLVRTMADFSPLNAQVDATLASMGRAVDQIKKDVAALAAAAAQDDAAAVTALLAKLHDGTATLDEALATVGAHAPAPAPTS